MDREKLTAFLAVAKKKSFSKAADAIFRTQPAVSHAIKALEEELGERLFLRLGRETRLTRAGEVLREHVDEAMASLERAKVRIQSLHELREGALTIAASDTIACYVLPDSLRSFRETYPGVEVRLLNRPSPVAGKLVAAGEADMGIVTLPISASKVRCVELVLREDVGICAPDHPLAGRKRVTLEKLAGFSLLLLDHGSNTRAYVDEKLRDAGLEPAPAMELGSIEVIKHLVRLGFGVSIVPRIAVRRELETRELRAFRVFAKAEARRLGAVIPHKGMLSRAAEVYLDMLRSSLRGPII